MKQYKPRDKITQKITREGAANENQATGETENISQKEKPADFSHRLNFTEEERAMPELERYIRKSEKAADKFETAKKYIPTRKSSPASGYMMRRRKRAKPNFNLRK